MSFIRCQPKDIAEPRALVEAIRARRGGTLLNLDCMLLHSPALADGWNSLLRAVRTELDVSAKLRELAICIVAVLNDADYEYHHHAPLFLEAGGTAEQLDAISRLRTSDIDISVFDAGELAIIKLAVEMTRSVQVSRATKVAVQAALPNDKQVVEIVGVIAAYNMVSRFLVALEIDPE
jgi:alkylhydroperoxidase family enzyme